jgi:hypothetical protein
MKVAITFKAVIDLDTTMTPSTVKHTLRDQLQDIRAVLFSRCPYASLTTQIIDKVQRFDAIDVHILEAENVAQRT